MDKVSVIMPVYNAERYLKRALDDVLHQTYKNIEVICVDDGSDDSSLDILKDYKSKDDRVFIYRQTEQSDGAAFARNLGLKKSVGDYLLFLDADDMFEPTLIEDTLGRAQETGADIVMFDAYIYDSMRHTDIYTSRIVHYRYLPSRAVFAPEDYPETLFQMYAGAPWNHLFKTDFIKRNDIVFHPVHISDDLGFVHTAYACAKKVAFLRKRLVRYRRDAVGNQTSEYSRWPESGYAPYVYIKDKLVSLGLYDRYKVAFVRDFLDHADFFMNQMDSFSIFSELYNALKDRYFRELDVYDVEPDKLEPRHIVLRELVKEVSAECYLVKKNNDNYYSDYMFNTCHEWNDGQKKNIILYGAGVFGRKIYGDLLEDGNVNVIHWVDRDYKRMGGCVESPYIIADSEADMVFVAILDEHVFISVKEFLLSIHVDESKIMWMQQTCEGE